MGEHKRFIDRRMDAGGAAVDLAGQRFQRRRIERARRLSQSLRVRREAKAVQ